MNLIQTLALVTLAAVWAWVLGRPLIQNLFNVARRDPVGHFNKQLSVLGQAPERSLSQAAGPNQSWTRQPARKRRLQVMIALVLAVLVSAGLAVVLGGIFVWQVTLLGVMLLGYLGLAARAGAYEAERGTKVSYLNAERTSSPISIQAVGER